MKERRIEKINDRKKSQSYKFETGSQDTSPYKHLSTFSH